MISRRQALALAAALPAQGQTRPAPPQMQLGAFSVSLAVKDIAASREFYEKFGFKAFYGAGAHPNGVVDRGVARYPQARVPPPKTSRYRIDQAEAFIRTERGPRDPQRNRM